MGGETAHPLEVLVVGSGIGGLSAAIALRQAGHHVRVLEQASRLGDVGAGIQLAPNATHLLSRWGVLDLLAGSAVAAQWSNRRRWEDSGLLGAVRLGDAVVERFGYPYWHAHRADLITALEQTATSPGGWAPVSIELGRAVVGVDPDTRNRALVRTADGAALAADVVVGADGIHSTVREIVFGPDLPEFSGDVAYRAILDADVARLLPSFGEIIDEPALNIWLGPNRHLVTYYVRRRKLLNVVLVGPGENWVRESWTTKGDEDEMLAVVQDWDERVRSLLAAAPFVNVWALYDRQPLDQWVAGRLCLLGDACHPMLPYQAQGAAQAMEDAASLAEVLSGCDRDGVEAALESYFARRHARATRCPGRVAREPSPVPHGRRAGAGRAGRAAEALGGRLRVVRMVMVDHARGRRRATGYRDSMRTGR